MTRIFSRFFSSLLAAPIVAAFALLTAGLTDRAAASEKRVALVIGNAAYAEVSKLQNPLNDANAVAEALERLGFEVTLGVDQTMTEMRATIRKFAESAEGADTGVFFYAGHGIQVGGANYLLPIDAKLNRELDLEVAAIDANVIYRVLDRSVKTRIIMLDACRDNPFEASLARSMGTTRSAKLLGRGLAEVKAPGGSLIVYATEPGNVAYDGTEGHSPFTQALLNHIETPGLEVNVMLTRVRAEVYENTREKQRPWASSSLIGEIYLRDNDQTPAVVEIERTNDTALELALWQAATAGGTAADFQAYLDKFPDGAFAAIATNRITALTAPTETTETLPPSSAETADGTEPDRDVAETSIETTSEDTAAAGTASADTATAGTAAADTDSAHETPRLDGGDAAADTAADTVGDTAADVTSRADPDEGADTDSLAVTDLTSERADPDARNDSEGAARTNRPDLRAAEEDTEWTLSKLYGATGTTTGDAIDDPSGDSAGEDIAGIRPDADGAEEDTPDSAAPDSDAPDSAAPDSAAPDTRDDTGDADGEDRGDDAEIAALTGSGQSDASSAGNLNRDLSTSVEVAPRDAEEDMALEDEERRDVQERLAALGHYTGEIHGLFDRETRSAIRSWQTAAGSETTGYLNRSLIEDLITDSDPKMTSYRDGSGAETDDRTRTETDRRNSTEDRTKDREDDSAEDRAADESPFSFFKAISACGDVRTVARDEDRERAILMATRACVARGAERGCCSANTTVTR